RRTTFDVNPDDGRDHLARLLDENKITYADVLARNLVTVVKRGARHRAAGELHRLEFGDRREHTGATHLDRNADQTGFGPLSGKLERHCPARCLARGARPALERDRVEFDDR